MGNVCQAYLGQAPARQSTLFAGQLLILLNLSNLLNVSLFVVDC